MVKHSRVAKEDESDTIVGKGKRRGASEGSLAHLKLFGFFVAEKKYVSMANVHRVLDFFPFP